MWLADVAFHTTVLLCHMCSSEKKYVRLLEDWIRAGLLHDGRLVTSAELKQLLLFAIIC